MSIQYYRISRYIHALPLIYGILIFANIAFVWWIDYFPTQDGPTHLYNLYVYKCLANDDSLFSQYYVRGALLSPNLGYWIFTYPWISWFSPVVADKIFISTYILLFGISTPVYIHVINKRPFPHSFIAFALLYNFSILMGFYSYAIGISLLMMSIAAFWFFRDSAKRIQVSLFNFFGVTLCFCHLLLFFIYVIVGVTYFALIIKERNTRLLSAISLWVSYNVLPVLFCLIWWLARHQAIAGDAPVISVAWRLDYRDISNLTMLSLDSYEKYQGGVGIFLFLIILSLCMAALMKRRAMKVISFADKWLIVTVIALIVVYFFIPDSFGVLALVKLRLVVVIVLIVLPLMTYPQNGAVSKLAGLLVITTSMFSMIVNAHAIYGESIKVKRYLSWSEYAKMNNSIAVAYHGDEKHRRVDPVKHAISYYCLAAKCIDAGNYEAASGVFNVLLKPGAPAMPPIGMIQSAPDKVSWSDYQDITYVIGWGLKDRDHQILKNSFRLESEKLELSIWRRLNK